jgi:exopolysaccharide biosynthesis polyprenyl glycosylphosphotransferase
MTTTTTTELRPVATVLADAVDVAARSRLVPGAVSRVLAPWLLVCAELVAGAGAAVVTGAVVPGWSQRELLSLVVAWPMAMALCGGYTGVGGWANAVRSTSVVRAAAIAPLLAWSAVAVSPSLAPSNTSQTAQAMLLVVILAPAISVAVRQGAQLVAPPAARRVVLVGEAEGVRYLLRETRRATASRRTDLIPVAICMHGEEPIDPVDHPETGALATWATTDDLLEAVRVTRADAVVVAPGSRIGHAQLRRWACWLQDNGTELLVSSGLRDVSPTRIGPSAVGGAHVLRVRPAAITGVSYRVKCAVDRAAAALLLVLLAPVLAVLALLIWRDSPGPAVFRQTRVGKHGKLFTVYKLRTMRQDADAAVHELASANESDRDGVLFKIRRDPRITPLGAVLRKYSIDELPQLVNVIRGEMSLIGPRPALPSEVDEYSPDLRRRLVVKPGLSGLWQVSGRSDLTWEETVRLDLKYVDNWSWRLDLDIALRTIRAVVGHHGAY